MLLAHRFLASRSLMKMKTGKASETWGDRGRGGYVKVRTHK
jgi:hypothetical protein